MVVVAVRLTNMVSVVGVFSIVLVSTKVEFLITEVSSSSVLPTRQEVVKTLTI